jgi:hypothetical protein
MEAKRFASKALRHLAPLLQTVVRSREQQGERHDQIDFLYRRGRFSFGAGGWMRRQG